MLPIETNEFNPAASNTQCNFGMCAFCIFSHERMLHHYTPTTVCVSFSISKTGLIAEINTLHQFRVT